MKIAVGSDHGGYEAKERVKRALAGRDIDVEDIGCHGTESVDYPDYAREVAARVADGRADQGVLVCTTGIGMAIAANKYPGVRAALCLTPHMAVMARTHNDANVLVLGGALVSPEEADAILGEWLSNAFGTVQRHQRRVCKVARYAADANSVADLAAVDPEVHHAVVSEMARQQKTLNLIASENYASRAVRQAQASVLTNKYAEGYPAKRWYNGCDFVDVAEALAIERAKQVFGADHANVQPHCGSSANMAVYYSVLEPGDTILAMSLDHGGHLTHGNPVNFSGRFFNVVGYGVSRETGQIDYENVAAMAEEVKPKLIVAGASSYPRTLDFVRFREIADSVGALFMVDMAHIAGLVAAGCHPSPVPHADFVTTTTHKTLRGPRSGLVLCREAYAAALDKQVFPGIQGGPMMHTIAAKAVCLKEAAGQDFKRYGEQVVLNARVLADALTGAGFRLLSGGTDNHLMLVDLSPEGITGKQAAAALDEAGIIANKNVIPFDTRNPFQTSGIRLGTPALTTRGMGEPEMTELAGMIAGVLRDPTNLAQLAETRRQAESLADRFPIP